MTYPKVDEAAFTEREGLIAVEEATNRARCIWREITMRDVGIDGQIEYVDPEGNATGRIIGVQVKSGPSYFRRATDVDVPYSVPERHRGYWREFPLPVILVLYDPEPRIAYWADARYQLRAGGGDLIRVPKSQAFNEAGILQALQTPGPLPEGPINPRELIDLMLNEIEPLSHCRLSFFDLFFQGLTDPPSWSVYFSMDLYAEVAKTKQDLLETSGGLTISGESFAFIDRYVAFLIAYDLARIDFDAFKRMEDQGLVGRILAPLTQRGLALEKYVSALDDRLPATWTSRVARDRPIQMLLLELPERTARIEEFKRRL